MMLPFNSCNSPIALGNPTAFSKPPAPSSATTVLHAFLPGCGNVVLSLVTVHLPRFRCRSCLLCSQRQPLSLPVPAQSSPSLHSEHCSPCPGVALPAVCWDSFFWCPSPRHDCRLLEKGKCNLSTCDPPAPQKPV